MKINYIFLIFVHINFTIFIEACYSRKHVEKINMILFFAESNKMPVSNAGADFLQMHEVVKVQPNVESNEVFGKRSFDSCTNILRDNLDSLIHFCKNAFGMNTAIVTVSSEFITEDLKDSRNKIQGQYEKSKKKERENRNSNVVVTRVMNSKDIVLSPEHTEVFKIRIKRNVIDKENRGDEFSGGPVVKENNQNVWNILDPWSNVKFSFFRNLFEDKKRQTLFKQENTILTNIVGSGNKDPGLFETVESTLKNLQESPEAYLMVVFGGHISDVSDNYSPLIQTLKHVDENTDSENTLLMLTGNCPEFRSIKIRENGEHIAPNIPVYAKGPNCYKLMDCDVLYNIPLILKANLEKTSPTFDDGH